MKNKNKGALNASLVGQLPTRILRLPVKLNIYKQRFAECSKVM